MAQIDVNSLIKIERHEIPTTITAPIDLPVKAVVLPAYDLQLQQHVCMYDMAGKRMIHWKIDMSLLAERYIEYYRSCGYDVPFQVQYSRLSLHAAEYYKGKLYAFPVFSNFFLCLDIQSDSYTVYQDLMQNIISSTNSIDDNKVYATRWNVIDSFKRSGSNEKVPLEFFVWDLEHDSRESLKVIDGPESIHQTLLSPNREFIFCNELTRFRLPNPQANIDEPKTIMQDSSILAYFTKSDNVAAANVEKGPAHVVFDQFDSSIIYLACCNLSLYGCHGTARIEKYQVGKTFVKLGSYEDDSLYRIPSHAHFRYNGKPLLCVAVYYNHVRLLDAESLTCLNTFYLSDSCIRKPELRNDMFFYPRVDRTPYTICPINDSPYIILLSVWQARILDIRTGKVYDFFDFSPIGEKLCGSGHGIILR